MKSDGKKKWENAKAEKLLLKELDKGIDSMEDGRTMSHDDAMQMIWEKLKGKNRQKNSCRK